MTSASNSDVRVMMLGLPASGKTTFLAALWHLVSNADQARFKVHSFGGNREYVNQLEAGWLAVEELPRTPGENAGEVTMNIEDQTTGSRFTVTIPDLSGEKFRKSFASREWPTSIDEMLYEGAGIVLFVNPNYVDRPTTIAEVDAAAAAAEGAAGAGAAAADVAVIAANPAQPAPWDPEKSPTAIVLVDLLEAASRSRPPGPPLRLSLVVSAWDTMKETGMTPEAWVRRDLSLLHQFLLTNPDRFHTHVYGVSAQGGDVRDPATRDRLRAIINPLDRIEVVDDGAEARDLSAPIAWLIN